MISEGRLRSEMESTAWENQWIKMLRLISSNKVIDRKIQVRLSVRLEDLGGVHHWVGVLSVHTDQVFFKEENIFDYENWQTDAQNLGKHTVNNILLRGLFYQDPSRG